MAINRVMGCVIIFTLRDFVKGGASPDSIPGARENRNMHGDASIQLLYNTEIFPFIYSKPSSAPISTLPLEENVVL